MVSGHGVGVQDPFGPLSRRKQETLPDQGRRHPAAYPDGPLFLPTGFATNELKLSRRGDRLQAYINGKQQTDVPFTDRIGPSVGFVVWNEIEVLFDNLVVTGY